MRAPNLLLELFYLSRKGTNFQYIRTKLNGPQYNEFEVQVKLAALINTISEVGLPTAQPMHNKLCKRSKTIHFKTDSTQRIRTIRITERNVSVYVLIWNFGY